MSTEKEVLTRLRNDLNIEDEKANLLYKGMLGALEHNETHKGLYTSLITATEFKNEISRSLGAIKTLNDAISKIDYLNRGALDQAYYCANNKDGSFMNAPLEEIYWFDENDKFHKFLPQSTFELQAFKMEKAIQHVQDNTVDFEQGAGTRKDAKQYIAGIEHLGWCFKDVLPNRKISASPSSVFYKYVLIWYSEILKLDIQNIQRHIKSAINCTEINKVR
jgi:hypothetical protein